MAGLLHVTERMREHTGGMKQIRVELINTGTEILLGSIVNTNAAWLGNRLFEALSFHVRDAHLKLHEIYISYIMRCTSRADKRYRLR